MEGGKLPRGGKNAVPELLVDDFYSITENKYPLWETKDGKIMRRKKAQRIHEYTCTITGEVFKTTREAKSPGELISVKAYYELHPENDDRPEIIRKELQILDEMVKQATSSEETPPEPGQK